MCTHDRIGLHESNWDIRPNRRLNKPMSHCSSSKGSPPAMPPSPNPPSSIVISLVISDLSSSTLGLSASFVSVTEITSTSTWGAQPDEAFIEESSCTEEHTGRLPVKQGGAADDERGRWAMGTGTTVGKGEPKGRCGWGGKRGPACAIVKPHS